MNQVLAIGRETTSRALHASQYEADDLASRRQQMLESILPILLVIVLVAASVWLSIKPVHLFAGYYTDPGQGLSGASPLGHGLLQAGAVATGLVLLHLAWRFIPEPEESAQQLGISFAHGCETSRPALTPSQQVMAVTPNELLR